MNANFFSRTRRTLLWARLAARGTVRSTARITTLAALSLPLAACISSTPHWDAQFGDSVRTSMMQQIRNPEAGENANAADGIDGRAATEVIERYHKSFREPQPQNSGLSTSVGVK